VYLAPRFSADHFVAFVDDIKDFFNHKHQLS
jgi:hypothetical protein